MDRAAATLFRVLPGLPPYGPLVESFPRSRTGREGLVVEFLRDTRDAWVGNVGAGVGGYTGVHTHPSGQGVAVFSAGNMFIVDPHSGLVREEDVPGAIAGVWEVQDPPGLILDRQGLAFERLAAQGVVWRTRRLSWDGFRNASVGTEVISGEAWSPILDAWVPFSVNLATGDSKGGSFTEVDGAEWERPSPRIPETVHPRIGPIETFVGRGTILSAFLIVFVAGAVTITAPMLGVLAGAVLGAIPAILFACVYLGIDIAAWAGRYVSPSARAFLAIGAGVVLAAVSLVLRFGASTGLLPDTEWYALRAYVAGYGVATVTLGVLALRVWRELK